MLELSTQKIKKSDELRVFESKKNWDVFNPFSKKSYCFFKELTNLNFQSKRNYFNALTHPKFNFLEQIKNFEGSFSDWQIFVNKTLGMIPQGMKMHFKTAYFHLQKKFEFPGIIFDKINVKFKFHEGLTNFQRSKLINFCVNGEPSFQKWACLVFLKQGLRLSELKQFIENFRKEKFSIRGKKGVIRAIFPNQEVVKFWDESYKKYLKIGSAQIYKYIKKILAENEMPQKSTHDLRVSFATTLAKNGFNSFIIQKLMGHQDINQTQKYVRISDDECQIVVNDIDKMPLNLNDNRSFLRNYNVELLKINSNLRIKIDELKKENQILKNKLNLC